MQKLFVLILNKIPLNGWKTEIGLVGLALVFFLTKFQVLSVEQASMFNTILTGWTGMAFIHHKNK